jgi:hypothetical protein
MNSKKMKIKVDIDILWVDHKKNFESDLFGSELGLFLVCLRE